MSPVSPVFHTVETIRFLLNSIGNKSPSPEIIHTNRQKQYCFVKVKKTKTQGDTTVCLRSKKQNPPNLPPGRPIKRGCCGSLTETITFLAYHLKATISTIEQPQNSVIAIRRSSYAMKLCIIAGVLRSVKNRPKCLMSKTFKIRKVLPFRVQSTYIKNG